MKLSECKLLFLDCQTTGMRPSVGSLLEMAWGWGRACDDSLSSLHHHLIQLPEGREIPWSVRELTGIHPKDLTSAIALQNLFTNFISNFETENENQTAIIHYAQFEKPFLDDLFQQCSGEPKLPFEVFCSQKIAKRLFPQLPSRNIRGLAGYFGTTLGELKRAHSHVQATFEIWKGLVDALQKQNIETLEDLKLWLSKPLKSVPVRYEYRIEKEKRLTLPEKPGIYRMKAKSGEILYVGKASSLKNRVNSYFRGKKGRDPKKLEMLTQVWDLDFVETETALEAALLENDEIKRLDPPYNINLKARERRLQFYSRDFSHASSVQNDLNPLGPFRPGGSVDQLQILKNSLRDETFYSIFYQPVPEPLIREGFEMFCADHDIRPEQLKTLRSILALGTWLLRKQIKAQKNQISEEEIEESLLEEEVELTPQEVSEKWERLFIRAATELRRAKRLTALLNAHIEWESEIGWKTLEFHNGKMSLKALNQPDETNQKPSAHPWKNLDICDYDRMSILLSEILRKPHRISTLDSKAGPCL